MHEKHGRYYYVHRNRWRPLSKDYFRALAEVAAIEAPSDEWAELVQQVYDRYEARNKSGNLADNTISQYRGIRARIEYGFAEFRPEQVKASDITRFLDMYEKTPNMANRMLTVIKAIFERAVRQGLAPANPAYGIKRFEESKRTRYMTDAEFIAIWSHANATTRLVMDMCYLTAQRISDVLAIEHSHITVDCIQFRQQKTDKPLEIEMSPELEQLIKDAKGLHKIMCKYLFHPRGKQTKYGYAAIRDAFDRAKAAAGVAGVTLHDIRAKSITDAKAAGIDPQKLAGHASPAMTERYIRMREIDRVSGPSIARLRAKP